MNKVIIYFLASVVIVSGIGLCDDEIFIPMYGDDETFFAPTGDDQFNNYAGEWITSAAGPGGFFSIAEQEGVLFQPTQEIPAIYFYILIAFSITTTFIFLRKYRKKVEGMLPIPR